MARIRELEGWIWLGAALLIVAIVAALSVTSSDQGRPLGAGNAHGGGALALHLWLQRTGYQVGQSGSSDLPLTSLTPGRDTLLLLALQGDLTAKQVQEIRSWTRSGGTAVVGSDGEGLDTLRRLGMAATLAPLDQVHMVQPLLAAPPTSHVSGQTDLVSVDTLPAGEVARTQFGAALVQRRIGRGVLRLLTAPHLLDNGHIAAAENRKLALNLVGPPGSRVEFAEPPIETTTPTGQLDWVTGTVWGIAVLFVLLISLLFRWLAGWRLGPPVVPFRERRRPAVEYVLSLADLLRRGRKRSDVLAVYERELRQTVARRFGSDNAAELPPELAEDVQRLLQHPAEISDDELLDRSARILECEDEVRGSRV